VFLDTSGWLALLNADEPLHPAAHAKFMELGWTRGEIVLTDWIVAETGNCLARSTLRQEFVESVRRFTANPSFHLIRVSESLLHRALALYSDRPDKTWGLVDCASFLVMTDHGVSDVFTTDRHFEQAGFNCLLPASAVG
jgi:predicted nucleic acid-binding protein